MARSSRRSSGKPRRAKPARTFRRRVDDEVIDDLLRRFVELVKRGLELMLTQPSALAERDLRRNPALLYGSADIRVHIVWAAWQAYDLDWPAFCQHVLTHPAWQTVLGVQTQADLDAAHSGFDGVRVRLIELAVHDALKEGDKQDARPASDPPPAQDPYAEYIGVSQVLKALKKQLRPLLQRLDAHDPRHPRHRPRTYRTRSFLLADLLRWMVHLDSTNEVIRVLEQHPGLAGAVNFKPGEIPSPATFGRRRMAIPLDDLKAILNALIDVLTKLKVIDGRAWVIDLTRVPTFSSVSKHYPTANGKSDPEAAFAGYPDNDGGFQLGYSLLFVVDFKSELPFALLFADGAAQDSPLTKPLLEQAVHDQPDLAQRCFLTLGDASYDAVPIFEFILERLRAIPVITKNPRNAADPLADLATDELCVLRRPSVCHRALFRSRTAVERTNSRIKLTFNLKYHKQRGRNAVEHCALFAAIAMLGVAWVALDTGHPEKIRSAWTWISLK